MASVMQQAILAKKASYRLSQATTVQKDRALKNIASEIRKRKAAILRANAKDLKEADRSKLSSVLIERLTLTEEGIEAIAKGVLEIVKLPDPVGNVLEKRIISVGLRLRKVSVPIGVIAIIYESRPNVTVDAAALCLKSGNCVILKGGSDAYNSNRAFERAINAGLKKSGLPDDSVQLVHTKDRKAVAELLKLNQYIDLVIPRGGEGLVRYVVEFSNIPVIMHYKGVCTVYVDRSADLNMAVRIVQNSKMQRPGVCNAAENLLVHSSVAKRFLPKVKDGLKGVELRGDVATRRIIKAKPATEKDWSTEYLDLKLAIKVVKGVEEAIDFINSYGSHHTDSIVTKVKARADRFMKGVDSSSVFWNASTRFADGGIFGMGAEMGISTQKLHARGPMGLQELTSYKYLVTGKGQARR